MWFIFTLISLFGWGFADLFYKKASAADDKDSEWKIAVWVGLVMGVCAIILIPFAETTFSFRTFIENTIKYLPASLSYIISMIIGYAGLRYMELSIISPVQNASGGLSMVVMVFYFLFTGSISSLSDEFGVLDYIGLVFIIFGVIFLAIIESKESRLEQTDKKYKMGALALIFPLLYCLFDTIGTAADGIILDEEVGLGLGEIDVLILYGLTFMLVGLGSWIFMWIKNKRPYNPFRKSEKWAASAACAEEFGQIFYVYAMALKPVLAAPIIASYCIVSVVLSRIFLKEKLTLWQRVAVILVIIGIVLMGISEGLANI